LGLLKPTGYSIAAQSKSMIAIYSIIIVNDYSAVNINFDDAVN
jgi:ABC-type tungstate transport system permease subunit